MTGKKLTERINTRLEELIGSLTAPKELTEGMRHALAGGKRLRPRLLLETASELEREDAVALEFACALEILHTASLIHDDLPCIDNDLMRRGQESNFARYGEAFALLQGDALLNFGYTVLLNAANTPAELRAARYISIMAGAEGMLGGQYEDVRLTQTAASMEELTRIHRNKTAKMFAAAIAGGAILAGRENIVRIEQAALEVGHAFQIADDLIDAGQGKAAAGKTLGKDAANQKNTYVTLFGIDAAKRALQETLRKASATGLAVIDRFAAYIGESVL